MEVSQKLHLASRILIVIYYHIYMYRLALRNYNTSFFQPRSNCSKGLPECVCL